MRILVTGKTGQVVTALIAHARQCRDVDIIPLGRPALDLAQLHTLAPAIKVAKPDAVISAAAYTSVDKAESEPELVHRINGEAAGILAETAAGLGIPILHLSTDCVFDGFKVGAYNENDAPHPLSVYGQSKWVGEQKIIQATANHVIVRISWVYSPFGSNFVKTMLMLSQTKDKIQVVDDQWGCPTSALDLAPALLTMTRRLVTEDNPNLRGTFHLASPNSVDRADFARAVLSGLHGRGGKPVEVESVATSAYSTPARRPANSRLDSAKIANAYGISLPSWEKSLDTCLDLLLGAPPKEVRL